jgi:hypothetical protein
MLTVGTESQPTENGTDRTSLIFRNCRTQQELPSGLCGRLTVEMGVGTVLPLFVPERLTVRADVGRESGTGAVSAEMLSTAISDRPRVRRMPRTDGVLL